MADPSAIRPLSMERHALGTVGVRPEIEHPRPTLIRRTGDTSARVRTATERVYAAARKSLLDAVARARRNLRYMADEKPVHLVMGVAIAAFLAGAGLRLWRSHYE